MLGEILSGYGLSNAKLSFQGGGQTLWEKDHATFIPFGLMDVQDDELLNPDP
jgi:hypothetical protein